METLLKYYEKSEIFACRAGLDHLYLWFKKFKKWMNAVYMPSICKVSSCPRKLNK